jgi:hypothetical protein
MQALGNSLDDNIASLVITIISSSLHPNASICLLIVSLVLIHLA